MRTHILRAITTAGVVLGLHWLALSQTNPAGQGPATVAPTPALPPAQIVEFLSRTIAWYRELPVERQLTSEPADLTYVQENQAVANQVVQLAFDYARAQAQLRAKQSKSASNQPSGPSPQEYQRLTQMVQKTDQDIDDTQKELEDTRAKLSRTTLAKRKLLEAQVDELESEINLLQARRDALNSMVEFVSTSTSGGLGLRAQIEELARSVPASLSHPQGTSTEDSNSQPASTANDQVTRKPQPSGIWGLASDLVHLSSKRGTLSAQLSATRDLSDACKNLRQPLADNLRDLIERGNQLFTAADTSDPQQLAQEKQQLDAITGQFKQTSTGFLPLGKIIVLLDIYQRTLTNWRDAVGSDIHEELRELLLRISVLLALIGVVLAVGEIWRRTTFRYIHEARRRYQFLLLRRVVMWVAIILIIVLAFATQLGSAVTFAGLLTAGVAVALQNVIVSVVAYFFLIGKYGIRVGDRVQIAGVTGEVVDIGLVRIHVMELGGPGDSQPTGRVVALSNSIVFQPTAGMFKQIPGTNFLWHELKLTLSSETDYHTAKERITQSVNDALGEYRDSMEAQRRSMEMNLTTVSPAELKPKIRLHYTASGIEADIRYAVALDQAAEMDDHLMRDVMAALEKEPRLKLVSAETPTTKAGE